MTIRSTDKPKELRESWTKKFDEVLDECWPFNGKECGAISNNELYLPIRLLAYRVYQRGRKDAEPDWNFIDKTETEWIRKVRENMLEKFVEIIEREPVAEIRAPNGKVSKWVSKFGLTNSLENLRRKLKI